MKNLILGTLLLFNILILKSCKKQQFSIQVSPNPANDVITVSNINANMKASKVFVSNLEGKVIATQTASGVSNYTFDMSGVKAGVYFVNVAHASGVETVKFVKQ